ncbi:MAG: DUF6448 family protein [Acidobacteriia bacterium]|nr:DUF6448 family protein [Terriglobia bacterium]
MKKCRSTKTAILGAAAAALLLAPGAARAHCDGIDGPVVQAARKALESDNVKLALIWVQPDAEPAVRSAFARTMSVRTTTPEAREFAEQYFFETVVRLHRAGEGEPYTGLKPAGRDLGPAIPAADKAIAGASTEALAKLLTAEVEAGLRERFKRVQAGRNFDPGDVPAGRSYVKAYVEFLHYVEGLHEAAAGLAGEGR